jgi:heme-degrading monooxygenase HmoA
VEKDNTKEKNNDQQELLEKAISGVEAMLQTQVVMITGDLSPRKVMILVEWESKEAFENYINDPLLKEVHAHRENGSGDYIWQSFEKLEDFRPFFRD